MRKVWDRWRSRERVNVKTDIWHEVRLRKTESQQGGEKEGETLKSSPERGKENKEKLAERKRWEEKSSLVHLSMIHR